jgi:hypothetical protein
MNRSTPRSNIDLLWQWLTLAAIGATLGINLWSNLYPLNGQSIGAISNTVFAQVKIIPANYAFAIWGVIYLGLLAFGGYQLLPTQRHKSPLRRVRSLLVFACLAQSVWVFLFLARSYWLSVVAMLGILIALIGIYQQVNSGQRRSDRAERWLMQIPFSIYLAWISVATVVNIACALYSQGWQGGGLFSAELWTTLVLLLCGALGTAIVTRRRDLAYGLVFVWALVAIAVRQWQFPVIAITAAALAGGLTLLIASVRWKQIQRPAR